MASAKGLHIPPTTKPQGRGDAAGKCTATGPTPHGGGGGGGRGAGGGAGRGEDTMGLGREGRCGNRASSVIPPAYLFFPDKKVGAIEPPLAVLIPGKRSGSIAPK